MFQAPKLTWAVWAIAIVAQGNGLTGANEQSVGCMLVCIDY